MRNLIFVVLIGFIMISVGNSTIVAKGDSSDLKQMYEVLMQNSDVRIENWSVTAREVSYSIESEQEFIQQLKKLKKKFPVFTWNIKKDSAKLTAIGVYEENHIKESIILASTLSERQESYVIYEIRGSKLETDLELKLQNRKKGLFKETTTFFTCIEGNFSDNIDEVLTTQMNQWMQGFKAQEIESMKETDFISITAQSSLFQQTYVSDYYNLQLAMRSDGLGSSTSFVIGTPIITFEY